MEIGAGSIDQKRKDREALIQTTIMDFENYVFPKYLDNYKTYLGFILDRASEIESWQSNVDYPLVAATVDTMFANLYDFGYKFNVEDDKLREACNRAFDFRQCGKQTIASVGKEAILIGKSFARDFLIKEQVDETFFNEQIKTEIKTPTMEYISVFDVFYDRSYGIEKSPFKIVRTYTTGEDIKNKSRRLWLKKLDTNKNLTEEQKIKQIDSMIDEVLTIAKDKDTKPFSYYNCNNIRDLSNVSPLLLNKMRAGSKISSEYISLPFRKIDDKANENNIYLNKDSTTYEFVTYSTNSEVAYYVNGQILFEGKKEYNIGEIREVIFSAVPGSNNSLGIADNLSGLQNIINGMWNAFLDNIKLQLSDMYEVVGNSPFVRNGKLDFKKFGVLKVNQQNSIKRLELGVKDFTPINSIQLLVEFAQQRSGVNQYIMGGQGRAERVAGGIDVIINQYKSKLTPITDSINRMMTNMARSWVMMFLKYYSIDELSKREIIVVRKNKEGTEEFETFTVNGKDIKDIIDEDKISFSFDALYKIEMENNRNILKESLQYVLQYAQDKVNLAAYFKALLGQNFTMEEIFIDKDVLDKVKGNYKADNNKDFNSYDNNYNKDYLSYNKEEPSYDEASDYAKEPIDNGTGISEDELSQLESIIS